MSDDVNDQWTDNEDDDLAEGSSDEGDSIFDVFEPPPEIDPNRFGPVPVIGDDDETDLSDDEEDLDPSEADESISAIFGFDPAEPEADAGPPTEGAPVVDLMSDDQTATGTELPHWTEPATGVVPTVIARERDPGDPWSEVAGPRWHGEGPQWAGDDLEAVFADEEGVGGLRRVTIEDDPETPEVESGAGSPQRPQPKAARVTQRPQVNDDSGERNMGQAVGVGVGFAAIAAVAFWIGKPTTLALILVVAALAAVELFAAMRQAGLHPATLLGIAATVALPWATYERGHAGFTLVIGLAVVFGALWYLVGADHHRPALNIGLTMLGITWIGGMAGFGALIVRAEGGVEVLLAAVLVTVASDTGAFIGGRSIGNTPFHSASPNKTWEGTIVGVISAVVVGFVIGLLEISVFSGNLIDAVLFGLVIGVVAPIGDLTESLVKRDLGVKDMGALLPGHGGILDRVDGLLFALPAAYYLGTVMGFF